MRRFLLAPAAAALAAAVLLAVSPAAFASPEPHLLPPIRSFPGMGGGILPLLPTQGQGMGSGASPAYGLEGVSIAGDPVNGGGM
ncbi:hypothetical protein HD593_009962 [Nonomuraea rubra]|uniref:Uncharacterized protein n=1 Tax=Nonomuraea rubra TaxID=46180 RepID=A0A7X0U4N3_9ACTN|nr:hypothetical protein [Nonomuraea rubra]